MLGAAECPACRRVILLGDETVTLHGRVYHRGCVLYRAR